MWALTMVLSSTLKTILSRMVNTAFSHDSFLHSSMQQHCKLSLLEYISWERTCSFSAPLSSFRLFISPDWICTVFTKALIFSDWDVNWVCSASSVAALSAKPFWSYSSIEQSLVWIGANCFCNNASSCLVHTAMVYNTLHYSIHSHQVANTYGWPSLSLFLHIHIYPQLHTRSTWN